MSSRFSSERGAILIQVALASIALIAFTMFVVDYGILWVSRSQAQNAADSGALAGAVALGFDDFADRTNTGPAKQSAREFAVRNTVFGAEPDVVIDTDVIFYDDDPSKFPAECADGTCIRVDVYRTGENGRTNPLPMWFGQLVGLSDQGVRATAIARAAFGTATDCLKPWAVIDRWEEHWPTPVVAYNDDSVYDKYFTMGPNKGTPDPDITDPDVYLAPSASYDDEGNIIWSSYSPGTGFHPFDSSHNYTPDYGRQMTLKVGDNNDFQFGSGWFMALALEDSKGGKDYKENIKGCVGTIYQIGDELEILNEPGNKVGPTKQGVEEDADSLVQQDPGAHWRTDCGPMLSGAYLGCVEGSAFDTSPRIVAVPLVNPDLVAEFLKGGRTTVPIANIAGFFIEGMTSNNKGVIGRLVTLPGLLVAGGGSGGEVPSTFMLNISLIR